MSIIIKNEQQIKGIKKSCQIAAKTLAYLGNLVEAGVSTEYLDQQAIIFMRDHGAVSATLNYHGYPKSICTSVNEVICHGIPSPRTILKEGDIISIDVTTIVDGYYGDTCQTFSVGELSKPVKELIKNTKKCLEIGIKEVYPGNRFGNIGYKINKYASIFGYGVVYQYTGHGVGIEFHEDPEVLHAAQKNSGEMMVPGMIFTIEPMINIGEAKTILDKKDQWTVRTADGSLSAQFEHTILVTKTNHEVLTAL
jgi:methionyl aminopeptidase